MLGLTDINDNNPMGTKYSIKFLLLNTKVFTKELLKSSWVTVIPSITISSEDYGI